MEHERQYRANRGRIRTWLVRGAALAGVVLLSLMIVIAVRTYMFRSRQVTVPRADAIELRDGFEGRLAEAIRLRTTALGDGQEFDPAPYEALHALLVDSFPNTHQQLDREVIGGHSLLYRWRGTTPTRRPILLMSHLDVVPVEAGTEGDWTHPPFSGAIADGFIWGRGALDVKCGALGSAGGRRAVAGRRLPAGLRRLPRVRAR